MPARSRPRRLDIHRNSAWHQHVDLLYASVRAVSSSSYAGTVGKQAPKKGDLETGRASRGFHLEMVHTGLACRLPHYQGKAATKVYSSSTFLTVLRDLSFC